MPLFTIIIQSKPKLRKLILAEVGADFLRAIAECCDNLLRGNIKIAQNFLVKLKQHKKYIRFLADSSIKLRQKKQLIVNKGATLIPLILSPLLPLLYKHFNEAR